MPFTQPCTGQPERPGTLRDFFHAASYRRSLPVTQIIRYAANDLYSPLCPRCRSTLEREYAAFCDRCGQKLRWDLFDRAEILTAPVLGGREEW